MANKNARILWAMMTKGCSFDRCHKSAKPVASAAAMAQATPKIFLQDVELKKQRTELYKKAKPYLEKAKEIDPSDAQINRTLKQVELYTAE